MLSQSGLVMQPLHGGASMLAPTVGKLLNDARAALDRDTGTVRSCLTEALALLDRDDGPAESQPIRFVRRGGFASWQENRVVAHIDAHLDGPIRIADLAGLCRLSAGYFSVAFRQTFGLSPQTYLAQRRVERAQQLMASTDLTLTDIALACGFCDQAHFCRRFRRVAGCSPNAWRRRRLSVIGPN